MRIAVVSPFIDRRHGTERALAEMLERLVGKYVCEVHLYAERVEDLPLENKASPATAGNGFICWHKVPRIPGPHILRFIGWMFLNGLLRRWDQLFSRQRYDLVLSPGINCLQPDVVIVHALFFRLQELARAGESAAARGGILRGLHRRVYYALLAALERHVYTNRKIVLAAVSRRTANLLKEQFSRNDVAIVPNGVDCQEFSPAKRLALRGTARRKWALSDSECVLLLLGNDWRVKGLPAVLEALAALHELPLRLLVAGNDDPAQFRHRATELGIENKCLWQTTDAVDVTELYAAADIYVSPSREDSFGLPVAESMACGLPVITSKYAGVAELVRDGVDGIVLSDPLDISVLVETIRRLQSDGDLRRRLGQNATETIAAWNWDRSAESLWKILTRRT